MKRIIMRAITRIKCSLIKLDYDKAMWIHPTAKFNGIPQNMVIGKGVRFHRDTRIDVAESGSLKIGRFSEFNVGTRIECMNEVKIGESVLTGPYVYISDRSHQYKDISRPILEQGYSSRGGVNVGGGTWIGIHAAIIGSVTIGNNCVIGANAVVTKDIPDYSVAVGNPAKIIKRYNQKKGIWEKV